MFFKAFAAFVRRSEGFLYLPFSAVALLLLNLLLLPNLCDCRFGTAWASPELPACSRQEHPG